MQAVKEITEFGAAFERRLKRFNLSQTKLSELTGISQPQISAYKFGARPLPDSARKIAAVLHLDWEALTRGELIDADADPPSFDSSGALRMVPVLSIEEACAGAWRGASNEGRETAIFDAPDDASYAVRVPDRRMSPRFDEGEIVHLSPRARVARDDWALVSLKDGRCLLARWREFEGRVILGALHPDFEPVIIKPADVVFAHRAMGTKT